MKKRYIFLAVVLFTNILLAQRGDDFMSDDGFDDLYSLTPCYVDCGSTEVGNFYFGTLSFNNALSNQALLERAKLASMRAWFNTQKGIIKSHIESKFYKSFSSYNDAKDALFANSEASNIATNLPIVTNQYAVKKNTANTIQKGVAKNLKLLEIRKTELSIGSYAIQKYPYIKVNGKALKDITSLAVLEAYKSVNSVTFQTNEITLNDANNMYYFLRDMATNDDFKNKIVALKNSYYSSFSDWNELNYMQFLINYEELKRLNAPPQYNPQLLALFAQFKDTDIATTSVIEDYALKNNNGIVSIFEESYIYYLAAQIGNGMLLNSHISTARTLTEQKRAEALNDLLDDVDTTALAIENLIGQLNITDSEQTSWLYANEDEAISFVDFLEENGYRGVPTTEAIDFVRGQVALEALTKDIPWVANVGYIKNKTTLKYTHTHFDGNRGYYKLEDGSIVALSVAEQTLTKSGDLTDRFRDNIGVSFNEPYYYIKLPEGQWSELLFDSTNLADELEVLFKLGGQNIAKVIGTYVIPVEDIKILIDGKDFNGVETSRWLAAGLLLIEVVPGGKLLKAVKFVPTSVLSGTTRFVIAVSKATGGTTQLVFKIVNGVVSFGNRSQLAQVIGTVGTSLQAHHLIPWALGTNKVVQNAAKASKHFHLNEALNGIAVAAWRNQPNHSSYNNLISSKLDNFLLQNPSASPLECYNFISELIGSIIDWVVKNPNSHLNDLILP